MKRKLIALVLFVVVILASVTFINTSDVEAQTYSTYKWINIKQVEITAPVVNVRTGPSTNYQVINKVKQGQIIDVVGALGSWYVVHLPNNSIGLITSTWTKVHKYNTKPANAVPTDADSTLTDNEAKMFDLINESRAKEGLEPYVIDEKLMKVAKDKAEDMITNDYFAHYSPTFGSPFEMLEKYSISYQSAAENIAGNSSVTGAHYAIMNSPSHKTNIMSTRYTNAGIGIANSDKYGMIIVQIFSKY